MSLELLALAGTSACALCMLSLYLLLKTGLAERLALDQPNARSLHAVPTPRCGGLGVMLVEVLALVVLLPDSLRLLLAVLALASISWIDDRRGLPILLRFGTHGAAALLVVLGVSASPWWAILLAVVAIVWGTNLFNFMDGANGMSASMLVTGFTTYALAALPVDRTLALLAITLAGAGLGFWYFNRTPAKMFLGDAGSIPGGFLMGAFGLIGWQEQAWPFWFPWLVFSPFVADATFTLLRRGLRGEPVWRAHREHVYQRLVRSGASHANAALLWFSLSLIAGVLALLLRQQGNALVLAGIAAYVLLLCACAFVIEQRFIRHPDAS